MERFSHAVVIDPTNLTDEGRAELRALCDRVDFFDTAPDGEEETIRRMAGCDALFVSYKTPISAAAIASAPGLRYIGMCCSLYGADSANVDIRAAEARGIPVTGIFDYGDEGVIEYEVAALVNLLHGFEGPLWRGEPRELGGLKVGIIGLGTVGIKLARALQFFGAQLYYFSRTPKPQVEKKLGIRYLPLKELLQTCDAVSTHLPRGTRLLGGEEFAAFTGGKLLLNTSLGDTFDRAALKEWLAEDGDNYYLCDGCGIGDAAPELEGLRGVLLTHRGSGASLQMNQRLSRKVLDNALAFLQGR